MQNLKKGPSVAVKKPLAGNMNSTTLVDVLAAPGAGVRRSLNHVTFYNKDSAEVTVELYYDDNGTAYKIGEFGIESEGSYTWKQQLTLDTTTKKVQAKLSAVVAATQPNYVGQYEDGV